MAHFFKKKKENKITCEDVSQLKSCVASSNRNLTITKSKIFYERGVSGNSLVKGFEPTTPPIPS